MIDIDLRSSRFEKEQQKRREDAKKRRAKEEDFKQEQLKREREQEALAIKRREQFEEAEAARLLKEAEEQRITGGIAFTFHLRPYIIDGEDDKVILPETCLSNLNQQDAFGRGALTFQLKRNGGLGDAVTHCGVREFSANEGTIGIPKKVFDSLSLDIDSDLSEAVTIKYVILPKCKYAKLRPKYNNFFDVGPVKQCLEENLRCHTTLSAGDILTVWYRGK